MTYWYVIYCTIHDLWESHALYSMSPVSISSTVQYIAHGYLVYCTAHNSWESHLLCLWAYHTLYNTWLIGILFTPWPWKYYCTICDLLKSQQTYNYIVSCIASYTARSCLCHVYCFVCLFFYLRSFVEYSHPFIVELSWKL